MDSCNFTNKANSDAPKVEIHTRPNLCHFGRYVVRAKLVCLKSFVPVTRAGMFMWEDFHPVTKISVAKTEILATGQPGLSYEHIDNFTKKRVARQDLGNRASPVDRAQMKRPWQI